MTVTTAETLSVNGTVLNTLAKNIESLAGRLKVADLRTDNVSVPGRHGTLRTAQKYYSEGQIILPMWVRGTDDNGVVTTSGRELFMANVNALSALFRPGDGMLEVVHVQPDNTSRRCFAEVTEVIDFSTQANSGNMPIGKFSVALRVPEVFWEDLLPVSVDLLPTQVGAVSQFVGATAPIGDAIFKVTGPATGVRVEATYNGQSKQVPDWFQYLGTVSAGQTLTIDCSNWTLTGGGGHVVNYANFTHSGGSRWVTMVPGPAGGAPELKITASSTTIATKVNVQARRKYLVG